MTDKTNLLDNAVPGTSGVRYGRSENTFRIINTLSNESSNEGGSRPDNSVVRNDEGEVADEKMEEELYTEGINEEEWTDNRIRKIEDTLGTLGHLIDEYRTTKNDESNCETGNDYNKMEIEQERTGKRKKQSSPINTKEEANKDDKENNIRPVKRVSIKSKIDTSLPIYRIDSSSEEEGTSDVEFTGMDFIRPDKGKKIKATRKTKRRSIDSLDMSIKEITETKDYGNYEGMSAPSIGSMAIEWLNDIDLIRKKCGNIQGRLSGHIKDRVTGIKEIIRSLIRKADCKGDPSILRARNIELMADLKALKSENESRKKETEILRRTVEDLKKEVAELRKDKDENSDKDRKNENIIIKGTEYDASTSDGNIQRNERQNKWNYNINSSKPNTLRRGKGKNGKEVEDRNEQIKAKDKGITEEGRARWTHKTERGMEKCSEELNHSEEERTEYHSTRDTVVESPERNDYINRHPPKREPRIKPKIIVKENIQIRPPFKEREVREPMNRRIEKARSHTEISSNGEMSQTGTWETVRRRRNTRAVTRKEENKEYRNNNGGRATENRVIRRPPKTVAVVIKGEEGFSYADALKKARTEISLKDIGIGTTKIKKAINGGIIIEIPGVENKDKANILVQKLKQILPNDTKITRPSIKGELRVIGFDESVKAEEIKEIITELGECEYNEINIGDIRPMRSGLFMTWVRCPLAAAVKLANNGKLKIGWSIVKVELLEARPKQCYKCWEFGHTRGLCKSEMDRSSLCFKCGRSDHSYRECKNELHCALCAQEGVEANHRIGSYRCIASKKHISNKASKQEFSKTQQRHTQAERRSVAVKTRNGSTDSTN